MNRKFILILGTLIIVILILIGTYFIVLHQNKKDSKDTNISESLNNIGEVDVSDSEDTNAENKNIAIVYFSATGNTEEIAEYISEITSGDLIEIIPKEEYTSTDLNYSNNDSRANQEQNDSSSRPEIGNEINVDSYDIIYLGFPIWWGDVPKIILTFLDNYDLTGKTVIPFCTSGGSGISTSMSTLRNYNQNINFIDGKRFSLSSSSSEVEEWIKTIY